jgi:uncharacterized protein (DUF4415 family)
MVATPVRKIQVRIDDDLWEAFQAKLERRRDNVSAMVRRAIAAYVEED